MLFLLVLSFWFTGSLASAQDRPLASRPITLPSATFPDDPSQQEVAALQHWIRDYADWKAWDQRWRNTREPGWFSTRPRRPRPVPPPWLPALCAASFDESGPVFDACSALRDWQRDDLAVDLAAEHTTQTRVMLEAAKHTLWWERIHLDGLWLMTQSGPSTFGVVGVHSTMHLTNRLQVFLVPGAILMRLPSVNGQSWSIGTDWGFSYSLFDFKVPAMTRMGTVHMNAARVWVLGGQVANLQGALYLAGFSVTFKQR